MNLLSRVLNGASLLLLLAGGISVATADSKGVGMARDVEALTRQVCGSGTSAKVNHVVQSVTQSAEAAGYLLPRVVVCESALPTVAVALINGVIAIDKDWAANASESELRFVLAHELGHVVARDTDRRLRRTAELSGMFFSNFAELDAAQASLSETDLDSLRKLAWKSEIAADSFAWEVSGATVEQIAEVLERFGDDDSPSHPSSEDRVARLKAY